MRRIVTFGNSGAGKRTLARRLFAAFSRKQLKLGAALSGPEFFEGVDTQAAYQARRASGAAPNEQIEQPVFDDMVGDVRALDVFELGCGDGRYGRSLLERGCHSYGGIDASSRMVAAAELELAGSTAVVTQGRLEELELPDSSHDLIVSRTTLHWLAEISPLFVKVRRALRPKGRFVFSVEHPVLTCCDAARVEGQGRRHWIVDDYFVSGPRVTEWFGARVQKYHRTIEQYFQELRASGFLVEDLREATPTAQQMGNPGELRRRQRVPVFLLIGASRAPLPKP